MHASTLRDAADTLTETVSDLAHTVAEMTPEVTNKVGERALKLAALTPWVDEPSTSWFRRRWPLVVGAVVALAVFGWWYRRNRSMDDVDSAGGDTLQGQADRHLRAAAGG